MLPCAGVILHAVGGSDQPVWTDDGCSTHVTILFDMEADLPGELPFFCVLAAHNTWCLEHAPPTVCKVNNQSRGGLAAVVLEVGVLSRNATIADWDNYMFVTWDEHARTHWDFICDIPQLSSSDPSSQSFVPSHSGFTLVMHLLFLHLYVRAVHTTSESTGRGRDTQFNKMGSLHVQNN